ncbi:MAG: cation:proton antiporter [Dehalococcoidia bacterium]
MTITLWYLIVGVLLISLALVGSVLRRLPLSSAMLYLAAGLALGPIGAGLITIDPIADARLLEHLTEVVVIISLFSAGLKLRSPFTHARWQRPVRLATISMLLTIALIAAAGVLGLGLSLGAAVLLGAMLAPTDPVLAADVEVNDPADRDRVRFSLTGEAGLNDGIAFPFVMLGLGLLELHALGTAGWRWFTVDVIWATAGGLGIGAGLGLLVGRLVLYLRREHKEAVGLDDFLTLGLIALAYGVALLAHTYGFLAVFAAGLALRAIERRASGEDPPPEVLTPADTTQPADVVATDPDAAPAYLAQVVLGFTEQLERIGEVAAVLILGGMLASHLAGWEALWFVPLLFFVIRPLAVVLGLAGTRVDGTQRALIAWFGIRGIGSVYYLVYAVTHGLEGAEAAGLVSLTLTAVAFSIVVHGVSVTPVMAWYSRRAPS